MKTKWMIIPAMILAWGCAQELETNSTYIEGEFTLYASSGEQETKTVLQQDGSISWSPADCINVFYGNKSGRFTSTNAEVASSAEFTGSLGAFTLDGVTEFVAAYPYSESNSVSGTTLSLTLPAEQTAVEGTFDDNLFICVAKSKDYNLHFYNVCGGVKFSLARDGIKKVVFKGKNGAHLAGLLTVNFASDGIPQVSRISNGKPAITLIAPNGGTFKKGSWYYLVIAPQILSQGYTMEFYTDELVETITSDSSVTILRSTWGVLKDIGTDSSSVPVPEAVDLGLSVKWANLNLGARAVNDYGDYYSWGETEPNKSSFTWSNYKWGNPDSGFTKYSPEQGITTLDPEDDAAVQRLKGNWRMATIDEFNELLTECQWEKVNLDGVLCYKVSRNGQFIYFPAYPGYYDGGLVELGVNGYYWSSTILTSDWKWAQNLWFKGGIELNRGQRFFGEVIRPVYDDQVHPVTSISLNEPSIRLRVGSSVTLYASFIPVNATDRRVKWSSSNNSVAIVSSKGEVTGVSVGSATVTVTTVDGGFAASCDVTVKENSPIPEVVDLGLTSKLKWASFNLGATKPEEYGDYFAWGETDPYYRSLDPLEWCPGKEDGYSWSSYRYYDNGVTKYIPQLSDGLSPDGKHALEPKDDAATVILGENWRMPTLKDFDELFSSCSYEWKSENGINYLKLQGRNGNYIILPASGYIDGVTRSTLPTNVVIYWSKEMYYYYLPAQAGSYLFSSIDDSYYHDRYSLPRRMGCPIRAVYDDK